MQRSFDNPDPTETAQTKIKDFKQKGRPKIIWNLESPMWQSEEALASTCSNEDNKPVTEPKRGHKGWMLSLVPLM